MAIPTTYILQEIWDLDKVEKKSLQAAETCGYGTRTTLPLPHAATVKHKHGECDWGPQRLQVPQSVTRVYFRAGSEDNGPE